MLLSRLSLFWKISIPAVFLFVMMMALTVFHLFDTWNALHQERIAGLQHIIQSAKTSVHSLRKQEAAGFLSRAEAQRRAKAAIDSLRYDNGVGYIFVYDWDGTNLVLPDKKKQGTNLLHMQDARGNHVIRDLIQLSKTGGGFYTYLWEKPGETVPLEKLSWVEAIPEWEWMLGTGIYTDDLKEAFFSHAIKLITLSLLAFLIAGAVSYLIIRSISEPLGKLIDNMGDLAEGNNDILVEGRDRQDEIGRMADAIQVFIENEKNRQALRDKLNKSMQEVKFNRDLLINAVNAINDGVVIFDESERLILANMLMQELYPSLKGHLEEETMASEIKEVSLPCLMCHSGGRSRRFCDCEKKLEDGNWYRIQKSQTLDGGTISIFSNISDYKQQNAKLQQQTSELVRMLQKEVALTETQRSFVSMASHEFKTPLSIIGGNVRRIEKTAEDISTERLLERVGNIKDSVQRMQFLIDRFMNFSRGEIDGMKLQPQQLNLRKAIDKLCEGYVDADDATNLEWDISELPDVIHADEVLLDQCLANIISNAIKYSDPGSPVHVSGYMTDDNIVIAVRDSGIGIAPEELGNVFKKYYRASSALSHPGTGIGLNFAQMVLQEHEGEIIVDSTLGEGSCFTIFLPRKLIDGEPAARDELQKAS